MTLFKRRFFKKLLLFFIITILLVTNSPVKAQDNFPPTISTITFSNNNDSSNEHREFGVSRIQSVQINTFMLDHLAEEVEQRPDETHAARFDVFENLSFTAILNKKEITLQGGYILSGYLENVIEGTITLVSTDGIISAIFTDNSKQYQLKKNQFGQYQFEEIDQSVFPAELDPIIPESISTEQVLDEPEPIAELDSGAVIDLMVVYTDDARAAAGGTTNMINLINLAVSETNTGYQRSNILQRMNLVHTAEVDFADGTTLNWSTALSNLTNRDGVIDEVHTLRDNYRADLVVMIVNNLTYCGIGWLMTPSYTYDSVGFSLVSRTCATGYYSLAHETGHNMGAHHDRVTANNGIAMYSYSYGYQAPNFAFRTIMAYDCTTGCPRINNWSNPEISYGGQPTGVSYLASNSADNRRTLNNTATIIANFRQSLVTLVSPSNLMLTERNMTSIGFQFLDNNTDESGFKIERSVNGGSWIQINTIPSNQVQYLDSNLTCNTNYSYRVKAYNTVVESGYSNVLNSATTECAPPDLPSTIQTIISNSSISLNWEDVDGELNYIVEESTDGSKNWSVIAVLDENETNFTLSGLLPGTTYAIRLSVENEYGLTTGEPILLTTMDHVLFIPIINH